MTRQMPVRFSACEAHITRVSSVDGIAGVWSLGEATLDFLLSHRAELVSHLRLMGRSLYITLDIDGDPWEVWYVRDTTHGFPVLLGYLANVKRGVGGGRPAVILTENLAAYLRRTEPKNVRLPIGMPAIKKLRARLGIHRYNDSKKWWDDRADDLKRLSGAEFARKHGVHPKHAADMKRERFGRTMRSRGWWRKPEVLRLLRSNQHRDDVAKCLGISAVHVNRLRTRIWREGNGTTARRPNVRDE